MQFRLSVPAKAVNHLIIPECGSTFLRYNFWGKIRTVMVGIRHLRRRDRLEEKNEVLREVALSVSMFSTVIGLNAMIICSDYSFGIRCQTNLWLIVFFRFSLDECEEVQLSLKKLYLHRSKCSVWMPFYTLICWKEAVFFGGVRIHWSAFCSYICISMSFCLFSLHHRFNFCLFMLDDDILRLKAVFTLTLLRYTVYCTVYRVYSA